MIKRKYLLASTLLMSGCMSANLAGGVADNSKLQQISDITIDQYFVSELAEELKDIRVSYSKFKQFNAAALTWYEAIYMGVGMSKCTIYNYRFAMGQWSGNVEENAEDLTRVIVHENTHHADMFDLIDHDDFVNAWERMEKDPEYSEFCENVDLVLKKNYPIKTEDELEYERVAKVADQTTYGQKLPEHMLKVYLDVLK